MCGNDCKAKNTVHPRRWIGWWSGFLLLLVPKCPFCFMAFSSVMVFCGEKGLGNHLRGFYSMTTLTLTVLFSAAALLSIFRFYRPLSGKYALLLVLPGIAALMYSVLVGGGLILYYTGAGFVLAGLLRNSGVWSFLEKMILTRNLRAHS